MKAPMILSSLRRVCADHRGATAVEYGLVIACIIIVLSVALTQLSVGLNGLFQFLGDHLHLSDG